MEWIPLLLLFGIWNLLSNVWLALIVCGGTALIGILLILKPFRPKPRRIAITALAAVLVATVASVAGPRVYENSLVKIGDGDMEIELDDYRPFGNNFNSRRGSTLAKTTDEPSTLSFADNLPRLDGATALYPLYAAFVRAVYPTGDRYRPYDPLEGTQAEGERFTLAACSRTSGAFANLLDGHADVIFLMDVSEAQAAQARDRGLKLEMTPIGREAFVFIVNAKNRVESLSQDEIRGIYSGEITNWRELGGANGKIEAYQRPENSGSQTALQKIMGDVPIIEPKEEEIQSFMGGVYNAVADYKNHRNALGYSFRFYIETMLNDAELGKVKLLSVDGVAPTVETIADGSYPFTDAFCAITVSNRPPATDADRARAENARKLIDWILSAQGRELVEKTGYVPLS
ncbi:MAG: substrate-binding domain-containing protein [Clostridiales Family XIII bacterium]|nr:substrate-binding domain-containing protein [Clostridiales Family XIII bacterium]